MRYYIADCHFFHEARNEKIDKRGFESVQAMKEYMIEKWNQKVRSNDEVVILGDFSWGNAEETNDLLDRLHGKLYMIRGNHDYFLQKSDFRAERFVWIKSYAEMQDNQRKVILCHYPVMCYNGQYRLDRKGNPRTYMLYGHVHDTMNQRLLEQFQEKTKRTTVQRPDGEERPIPSSMINCFCMYSDYTPLTLDEWIALDRERRSI